MAFGSNEFDADVEGFKRASISSLTEERTSFNIEALRYANIERISAAVKGAPKLIGAAEATTGAPSAPGAAGGRF